MKTLAAIVRPSGPVRMYLSLLDYHILSLSMRQLTRISCIRDLLAAVRKACDECIGSCPRPRLENVLRGPSGDAEGIIFTHPLARVWASGLRPGHVPGDLNHLSPEPDLRLRVR